ncbi:MFS transporter [Actinomadura fibrosa]|uniref:MFS transporter n=1 Tax=Actinomadura fibrosa TaxID=111802 RepID=A0ABW2XDY0_9ACTN|nr:MFS transporter [Actinomadura fibrosa]
MKQPRPWRARVFLGGQATSLLGDGMALPAVPLLVLELTRDPLLVALSAASKTLGLLCVGLPAGVLVDRCDPWRVLMLADALRAALSGALFALAATGTASVGAILVLSVAGGACQVFFETALMVVVKDLFPEPGLIRANAAIELARQMSLILGPAAVGVLAASGDLPLALLINALTFVVSLASLVAVRQRSPRPRPLVSGPRLRGMLHDFVDGLRFLLSVRLLVVMTALQMVVNLCLSVERLIVYYARDTLHLSPTAVSIAVASGGVASVVNRTQRQHLVPRELLGRITGTVRLLFLAVDPLGVVVAGALTGALDGDPRPVFAGAGAVVVTATIVAWYADLRRYR